jgi:hypothetical protein
VGPHLVHKVLLVDLYEALHRRCAAQRCKVHGEAMEDELLDCEAPRMQACSAAKSRTLFKFLLFVWWWHRYGQLWHDIKT